MHRVVALVVGEVVAFDLGDPGPGVRARARPLRVGRVRAAARRVPDRDGLRRRRPARPGGARRRRTRWSSRASATARGRCPPEPLAALREAAARGARVASICTGAFVLAAAGLLDGRRATTHWRYAERLAREFPAVDRRPGRALRRRGRRADVGRRRRRHRPVPAHRPARPRRRGGERGRAPDRGRRAPRRRAGAVRRAPAARPPRAATCRARGRGWRSGWPSR